MSAVLSFQRVFNFIGSVDGGSGFTAATDQTGTIASPLDPKFDLDGLGHNGGSDPDNCTLAWQSSAGQRHK